MKRPQVRSVRAKSGILESLEGRVLLSASLPPTSASVSGNLLDYQLPQTHLFNQRGSKFLTKPAAGKPLDIALKFLQTSAAKFGVTAKDFENPIVTDQYTDDSDGVTHIYLRQQFNGLEVANADVSVHISREGRVIFAGGAFVPNLAGQVSAKKTLAHVIPSLAADQALTSSASKLGLLLKDRPVFKFASASSTRRESLLVAKSISLDDIPAKLRYVATASGIKLAWDLVVRTPDKQHWYELNVDSADGSELTRTDWVEHANYNVLPMPIESPSDGARAVVTDPYDPVYSPFGWHDTNGIDGAEFTDTRGNNVSAQEDTDANNSGGFRPDGGASLNFDFPLDLAQAPGAYQSAVITNLFYWNNLLHDIHASYGFTEAAGNFQVKNYSGQGVGNDAVQADAQDGSGTNNANFATPPDGQQPRMQMFIYNFVTPNRDAALDNQIVIHEYGHGVSTRLTGGPANSSVLTSLQSAAMGEGWGDWWGMMLTQKPTDLETGAYPHATYTRGQPQNGAGSRRYPYSFDKAIDPLTYGNFKTNNEAHDGGEIWSAALGDMNWLLIDKYGYSADIAHGYDANTPGRNAGNNLALQLVMDALKLQPVNPSMLAARDAILAADQADTGGANAFQIWTAFARRGMGFSAKDGGSASSSAVTEAFDIPPGLLKPIVTGILPTAVQTAPISQIDVNFSKAMNPASFVIADDIASFTSPNNTSLLDQITGSSWINATTLRISFNSQSQDGQYSLVLGPNITSADDSTPLDQDQDGVAGEAIQDQYTAKFRYDSLVLAVTSTVPANNSAATLPFTTLDVNFNEPVAPTTIGIGDLSLSRGTVTGAMALDADTIRFTLSGITGESSLNFSIAAGLLTDMNGNPNKAYSGTLMMDNGTLPFPGTLTAQAPLGLGVYSGTAAVNLNFGGDTDTFTVNLNAGQTLTALLDPAATLMGKVEIFDPQGNSLGTASGLAAGKDVVVQSVPVTTAGTYSIALTSLGGTTGTAGVALTLNARVEAAAHDGPLNSTLATAENLDSGFISVDPQTGANKVAVLGTVTNFSDYYSFTLAAGDTVSLAYSVLGSTFGDATIKLLDSTGAELIWATTGLSVSSKSISDFKVPAAGTYYAVLSTGNNSPITNYDLVVIRNAGFESEPNDSITAANVVLSKQVAGKQTYFGNLESGGADYYRVPVNPGQAIQIATQTPGDGPNAPSNLLDPRLRVYSSSGVLLASDDNSAADGRNAVLNYVPSTGDSFVFVEVSSAGVNTAATGAYLLSITGSLDTDVPFTVLVSGPPNGGAINTSATFPLIQFSDAVLISSIQASDFTTDGVAATRVDVFDSKSIGFNFPPNLTQGLHTIAIAGGTITDGQGTPLEPFTSTFTFDTLPPHLIDSTIQENDLRSSGALSMTFKFDEAINTSNVTAADYPLLGQGRAITYSPTTATWSADHTTLTLDYNSLPDDRYTLTFSSSTAGFTDALGNLLDGEPVIFPIGPNQSGDGLAGGDFVVHFDLDSDTTAVPTLSALAPAGSFIYDNSVTSYINSATDTDLYTIQLNAGQALSAIVDLNQPNTLQAKVELLDFANNVIASASSPGTGQDAVLNLVATGAAGTYTIRVSSVGATAGAYKLELALNALKEPETHNGASDDTFATAVNLAGSFANIIPGVNGADRVGVLGGISVANDIDYYAVPLKRDDSLTAALTITGASSLPFSLYAPDHTLIAKAVQPGGSNQFISDFAAGADGTYYLSVGTGTSGITYNLTVQRNAGIEIEDNGSSTRATPIQTPPAAGGTVLITGSRETSGSDYYKLILAPGTALSIRTSTPGDGSLQPANSLDPTLRLYSSVSTQLASDDNSAGDGRNALLNYSIASAGTYYVEVSSPTAASIGNYVLSINLAQTLVSPFTATITTPANNAKLTVAPTSIVVDFNDSIDLSTLSVSDVTLDGVAMTAMNVVDSDTISFTPPTISQGTHIIAIASAAISDLQRTAIQALSSTFTFDSIAPRVIASSIQENDVKTTGALTCTITFDEPMLAANLDSTDFTLRGVNKALTYAASTFSYNAAGTILTLNYANLPEDRYTLTLLSATGRFEDPIGNDLDGEPSFPMPPNKSGNGTAGGNFIVDFDLDPPAPVAFPAPLNAVAPAGGQIYEGSVAGLINTSADTDSFTLSLDGGQTLTLLVPGGTSFKPSIAVYDSTNALVASATASAIGQAALLQTAINTAGVYTFVVSSANTNFGPFILTADLNAAREAESFGGPGNDSTATAQDLTPSLTYPTANTARGAVLGTFDTGFINVLLADFEGGTNSFTIDNSVANGLWHLSVGRGAQAGHSATHSYYFGANEGVDGGGTYSTGARTAGYLISPSVVLPASTQLSLNFNYVLKTEGSTSFDKAIVQISTNGGSSWSNLASYNGVAESTVWKAATPISLAAYSGQTVNFRWSFDTLDGGSNSYEGWYVDDIRVQVPASLAPDYYAINLAAGDRITLQSSTTAAANLGLSLFDSSGTLLTSTTAAPTALSALIDQFQVSTSGTYYARVTGAAGSNYTLLAEKNAAIEVEPNNTLITAQDISATGTVLGNLSGGNLAPLAKEDFETGSLGPAWTTYSSSTSGRISVTGQYTTAGGNYALLMDTSSGATLNEAIFTVNLAGQTQATLTFSHNDYNDEETTLPTADYTGHFNADGISISADGVTWHPIWNPPASQGNVWTSYTLDLAALAGGKVPLGSSFRIKFQQYDDNPLTTDGRGWDNISVNTPTPGEDYYAFTVPAGGKIDLSTLTPGDGPFEFTNTLDPQIDLYDPDGNLVGSDNNSALDGRNAHLIYTANLAGAYIVKISAGAMGSIGDYVLQVTAQPSDNPPPAKPDLLDASDTGVSISDNITRFDNSTPAKALQFSIAGTTAGATVSLYCDGVLIGTALASGTSTLITTDGASALTEGTHLFTSRQIISGKPESIDSGTLQVTIDVTAPLRAPVPQLQAASDTGVVGDNITFDTTPTFDLAPGVGNYFRFFRDGIKLSTDYESAATYTPTAQADGSYAYTIVAIDAAGNESAVSLPVTIQIITTVPAAPTVALDLRATSDTGNSSTDNLTNDNTPTFTLPAGLYAYRVYRNGVRISNLFETSTAYTAPTQSDGTADYTFTSVDSAGNESAPSPALTITIDTAAPAAPAVPDLQATSDSGSSNSDNITRITTPSFDLAGIAVGDYFRFFRNGVLLSSSYATGATYTAAPLPEGSAQYTLRAVDAAGNESASSPILNLTIDTTPPTTAIPDLQSASDSGISSTDNITNKPTSSFDIPGAAFYRLFRNGTEITSGAATGPFTEPAPLSDGTYAYTVLATDLAGNEAPLSAPLNVTIDTAAPDAPSAPDLQAASDSGVSNSDNVTNIKTPAFDLTGVSYFRLYRNSVQVTADTVAGSTFTSASLADGTYSFAYASIDLAGNVSAIGAAASVTIDTVAPTLSAGGPGGGLDPTFAQSGTHRTILSNTADESVAAIAMQSDGKAIVVGTAKNGVTNDWAIVRYTASGAEDPSFGNNGVVLLPIGTGDDSASHVFILNDGKILVGGIGFFDRGSSLRLSLARLNSDGSLDTTFGNGGKAWLDFPTYVNAQMGMAVEPDGKIVVAGSAYGYGYIAARFNYDGTLDGSFGSAGVFTTSLVSGSDTARAVAIQDDGKIIVGGDVLIDGFSKRDIGFIRLNPDGTLDGTFNGNGKLVVAVPADIDYISDIAIQPGGKILATGYDGNATANNSLLIRLTNNGALDPTFAGGGKTVLSLSTYDNSISDIAMKPDGSFYAAVQSTEHNGSNTENVIVAFTASGAVDPSFANAGRAVYNNPNVGLETNSLALQADGRIISAATTRQTSTANSRDWMLFRNLGPLIGVSPDLTPQSDTGISPTDNITSDTTPDFTVASTDDYFRIYRAGVLANPTFFATSSTATLAAQPDGAWDYTFTAADLAGNESTASAPLRVTIDTQSPVNAAVDLLATSDSGVSNADDVTNDNTPTVDVPGQSYRLFVDGTEITTSPVTGPFTLPTLSDGLHDLTAVGSDLAGNAALHNLTLQIIISTSPPPAPPALDLQSTSDTGISDSDNITSNNVPKFDFSGTSLYRIYRDNAVEGPGYRSDSSFTLSPLADGAYTLTVRAVDVAGNLSAPADLQFVIDTQPALFYHAAEPDTSFGTGGKTTLNLGDTDSITCTAIQADGKILAAGQFLDSPNPNILPKLFAVARFNADGSLDLTFGAGKGWVGFAEGNFYGYVGQVEAIIAQPDGKILLAGYEGDSTGNARLIRLNSDGTLDDTFGGPNGVLMRFTPTGTNSFESIALLADGGVLAAGYGGPSGDYDFILARFTSAGLLDPTFNHGQPLVDRLSSSYDIANAIVPLADGKFVVAGTSFINGQYQGVLSRYNADATLDTTFGTAGRTYTTSTLGQEFFNLRTLPNGNFIVGGTQYKTADRRNSLLDIARYNSNGTIDPTFGTDGQTTVDLPDGFGANWDFVDDIAIQSDGRIISFNTSPLGPTVIRFLPDGTRDLTFGNAGILDKFGYTSSNGGVALDDQGRLVVATTTTLNSHFGVRIDRYLVDGSAPISLQPASDTGASSSDRITSAINPTFDIGAPGYYQRVYCNGALISSAYTPGGAFTDANRRSDGIYSYTVTTVDAAGNESLPSSPLLVTIDTVSPTVVSGTFIRSMSGQSIKFQFSQDVGPSISAASLILTNSAGQDISTSKFAATYDPATKTATFTFPGFPGGILPDDRYRATVTGVSDIAGNPLSFTGATFFFAELKGDFNSDDTVDNADFSKLYSNYNKSAMTWSDGDLNGDQTVNFTDFQIFELLFGHTLPLLPAPAATPVSSPAATPVPAASARAKKITPAAKPVARPLPAPAPTSLFSQKKIKSRLDL